MTLLDRLLELSGDWNGSNTLHDPHTQRPETTPSSLRIEPVLQRRFVRMDYTWSYQGKPEEGSLLIGLDPVQGPSVAWIDTWHQGRTVMLLTGTTVGERGFDVRGTFPAPPDPDWGWRMVLSLSPDRIALVMTCVPPNGEAFPAADATWSRESAERLRDAARREGLSA